MIEAAVLEVADGEEAKFHGRFGFPCLPATEDRIHLKLLHGLLTLRVLRVEHSPVMLGDSDFAEQQRKFRAPETSIIATFFNFDALLGPDDDDDD